MNLAYRKEKPLFVIALVLSLVFWLALLVATFGIALLWLLLFFIVYLFAQSGFISHIRGNAVRLSEQQYPEIYQIYNQCCEKLGFKTPPDIYLLNGNGILNALATRFLGRNFVILFSDVVDALQRKPDAMKFYLGHELGHIKRNHLLWAPVIFPALLLPLLGAAYSRACEYTCDMHGQACCGDPKDALSGVAVLASGHEVWNKLNVLGYAEQSQGSGEFWMAFHELISDYPWLSKRMARMVAAIRNEKVKHPRRNPFAYLFALFVPRLGIGGGAGGMTTIFIMVAIIGILAAIAIPAYQGYIAKSQVNASMEYSGNAMRKVEDYIIENRKLPDTLADAGFQLPPNHVISSMQLDKSGSIIVQFAKVPLKGQSLEYKPYLDENKHIQWDCHGGTLAATYRPPECR
ncbi:MAG: M48 family metalloprotease [Gammaproteobacteria bacterium]|nr:M48 family metalloprotease [Gammaproteobacteria bacterium]